MPPLPSPQAVETLLQQVKRHVGAFRDWPGPPKIHWIKRTPPHLERLAELELNSLKEGLDVLTQLVPTEYSEGPKDEKDGLGGQTWVFGKMINGHEAYIKFSLRHDPKRDEIHLNIWSFHISDFKMKYPLRQGGKP